MANIVFLDLETEEAREAFALAAGALADVSVVPLRVRAGDDTSCLNLAVPRNPQLVAVRPDELATRGAFTFANRGGVGESESPWSLLERPSPGK